jgi:hypothetical protein
MVVDGGTAGVSSSADGAGIIQTVQDAYSQAGDEWASAEYRQEIAAVLARRCLEQVSSAEPEVEP